MKLELLKEVCILSSYTQKKDGLLVIEEFEHGEGDSCYISHKVYWELLGSNDVSFLLRIKSLKPFYKDIQLLLNFGTNNLTPEMYWWLEEMPTSLPNIETPAEFLGVRFIIVKDYKMYKVI